jgi:NADH-quinone oxidoreductase subunit L
MKKDLKRILAYSTVSQLGLMMLAIGMGEVTGAVFHLITHGFFKALLFLSAGSVIHGLPGRRSTVGVDDVGGLVKTMPRTYEAFLIGALAISGFFPFAGFFSKDMILARAFESGSAGLALAASLIAVGSSFYIFRMFFLTFHGERPQQAGNAEHAHEADPWMLIPMSLLASCSLGLGVVGPMLHALSWSVASVATGLALVGAGSAYVLSMKLPAWDWQWRSAHPMLERRLDADLGWQEFSTWPARGVSAFARELSSVWDLRIWDAWTEAAADSCVGLGEGISGISRGLVNEYLWWMLAGTAVIACLIALCF